MAFWDEPAEPQPPLLPQQQPQQPQQQQAPEQQGQGVSWDKVMEAVKPMLPSILPMLAGGVGAALTSPIKSGPMIAGRALMGGLQGWQEAEKLNAKTQKDLYYADRAKLTEARALKLSGEMADKERYAATITDPAKRARFNADPESYFKNELATWEKPQNAAWMAQRFLKRSTPEDIAFIENLPPKELAALTREAMKEDHDAGEAKTVHGQFIDVLDKDGNTVKVLVNTENNRVIGQPWPTADKGKDKPLTRAQLAEIAGGDDPVAAEKAARTLTRLGGPSAVLGNLLLRSSGLDVPDAQIQALTPQEANNKALDLQKLDAFKGLMNTTISGGGVPAAPAAAPAAAKATPAGVIPAGTWIRGADGSRRQAQIDQKTLPPGYEIDPNQGR